jgi:hypothetical protein
MYRYRDYCLLGWDEVYIVWLMFTGVSEELAAHIFRDFFYLEDGDSAFLRIACKHLPIT